MVVMLLLIVVLCVFLIARFLRIKRLRENLYKSFAIPESSGIKELIKAIGDSTILGSVALIDVLYDMSRVDPDVVEALNRVENVNVESFEDLQEFVKERIETMSEDAKEGFLSLLKGHVGELKVAHLLKSHGHEVILADDPTQPGWDIIVDGVPYNVKTTLSEEVIHQHFEQYPDIKVLLPQEMAHLKEVFGDNVQIVEGFSVEDVDQSIAETFSTAAESGSLWDLLDSVPWITIALTARRQYIEMKQFGKPAEEAFLDGARDVLFKATGATTGGAVGTTILGPGIGTFIGAVLGGLLSIGFSKYFEKKKVTKQLENKLRELGQICQKHASTIVSNLDRAFGLTNKWNTLFALKQALRGLKWWEYVWPTPKYVLLSESVKKALRVWRRAQKCFEKIWRPLEEGLRKENMVTVGLICFEHKWTLAGIAGVQDKFEEIKNLMKRFQRLGGSIHDLTKD